MLTPPQIKTIGMARSACKLDDFEYRDWIEMVSCIPGARSAKDPRLGNAEFDRVMATFEAIYERGYRHSAGLPRAKVFSREGYWQQKNRGEANSRDRYVREGIAGQIADTEAAMRAAGFAADYLRAIRSRAQADTAYLAALRRTLHYHTKSEIESESEETHA